MNRNTLQHHLCELYAQLNRRELVHPDPLEFLFRYNDLKDREIVGLVASGLAYGNVAQILKSVATVLGRMDSPHAFLLSTSQAELQRTFKDFKHRFTTGEELATMLFGTRNVLDRFGSLNACFMQRFDPRDETVIPALAAFVEALSSVFHGRPRSLLPSPNLGSACKRLNLFLRWMVRCDDVDPGGWDNIPASRLIIPLDVHMHRIARGLGFTRRNQANLKAAYEITAAFRELEPDDPVKYDFALTRLGIRNELDPEEFLMRVSHVLVKG